MKLFEEELKPLFSLRLSLALIASISAGLLWLMKESLLTLGVLLDGALLRKLESSDLRFTPVLMVESFQRERSKLKLEGNDISKVVSDDVSFPSSFNGRVFPERAF